MSGAIPNTDWSMIGRIADGEGDQRDVALDTLVRRYWPAIYAYIRRTGRSVDEAGDLTQSFIATVVLQRGLAGKADRARGRFRSLLLTSLKNYLHERHRYETRRSRMQQTDTARPPVSGFDIDAAEGRAFDTPEGAFTYHWSAALVRRVLDRVRLACLAEGLEDHWRVFDARVARPILLGAQPVELAKIVEQLDLDSESQASNMIVTVKRRFARALRAEIRPTVGSDDEVQEEVAALLRDLELGR